MNKGKKAARKLHNRSRISISACELRSARVIAARFDVTTCCRMTKLLVGILGDV